MMWDPARMAVVEGIDAPRQRLGDGTAQVVKYANQEVVLQVHANGDGFLSSSELHYPGWEAYLDGARIPIHYSNVAFSWNLHSAGRPTRSFTSSVQRLSHAWRNSDSSGCSGFEPCACSQAKAGKSAREKGCFLGLWGKQSCSSFGVGRQEQDSSVSSCR
jgi:hypothetical protein